MKTKRRAAAAIGVVLVAVLAGWFVTRAAAGRTHQQRTTYMMRGMVMKVASSRQSFVVSHDSIPGVMEAMTMSFDVASPAELVGVVPGAVVEFTLVTDAESTYVEHLKRRPYEAVEQDPLTAQRL